MNVWAEPHDYATQLGRDGLVLWVCIGDSPDTWTAESVALDRAQAEQLIASMRAILDRSDT